MSNTICEREPWTPAPPKPGTPLEPHLPEPAESKPCCDPVDMVSHPPHYIAAGIECIDAIEAATAHKPGPQAVCVANVLKYLWRYEFKGGIEDVKKARWYLDRLVRQLGG